MAALAVGEKKSDAARSEDPAAWPICCMICLELIASLSVLEA